MKNHSLQVLKSDCSNLLVTTEENKNCDRTPDFLEEIIEYPPELGRGYIQEVELSRGFSLTIRDYQHHNTNLTEISQAHEHPLQFCFKIKGQTISNIEYASLKTGETALCGCGMSPKMSYSFSEINQEIDIHIEAKLLTQLFGIQDDAIAPHLKHLFRRPEEEYSVSTRAITTQMQVALQQIWQCPFQGMVKQVYLQAKVLELMALRLQQDMSGEIIQCHNYQPKRKIIEQMYQAKEILESRVENPPSLIELAENVGLSLYQLKQGFQKVFGQSAFQYLHQYRMEQARLLLYEGNMRVADVANTVGYSHLGQFSAAFKRKFGISPRDCLKGKV
ncbi:helix-turn-helix transcriptional regulator [Anabaena sp. CCY 9910]|uniref:helix-turn-helix transcriptional regulator n=1 Tax=Anabaena sp. CCY 9910 TaxID=3103870 RepID=UPI0039E0C4E3